MRASSSRHWMVKRTGAALALLVIGGAVSAAATLAQGAASPFAAGEVLTYKAVSGRFGTFGTGTMRVDGPMDVRGQSALQLSFDFRGRIGFFKVEDRTRSWITTGEMASLRYERRERSPLGSSNEAVDIFPEAGNWQGADGESGQIACAHPLDELSFLYFLRSLPLADGEHHVFVHHFDAVRNPVTIRVLGRETTTVPAGTFETVVVEMEVRGDKVSTMRLYLTDDEARVPVRIESSAPWVGSTRLLLQSVSGGLLAKR